MLKTGKLFKQSHRLFLTGRSIQLHNYLLVSFPFCFMCACQVPQNIITKRMSSTMNKKPFTVFVEGNIGSGKTTFLNLFNQRDDITTYAEPVNTWRDVKGHNLLALMYEDASRWSLTFQTMVQKTMLEVHLTQPNTPIKMMERSIHSARHVFVDNLLQCNTMPAAEHAVLDSWYQFIISQLDVSGDLIIYLRTNPEVVCERIKKRSRAEETSIPLSYLQSLHELHDDWLLNKTHANCKEKVIVIDANQSEAAMIEEFIKCEILIKQLAHANSHPESAAVSDHPIRTTPKKILDVA
uniref:Deoxynucleoside kinase n=1 Tax=Cacopsylla melanoneura TaxID=428564 RepID=A0A8D9ABF9_9HEMI